MATPPPPPLIFNFNRPAIHDPTIPFRLNRHRPRPSITLPNTVLTTNIPFQFNWHYALLPPGPLPPTNGPTTLLHPSPPRPLDPRRAPTTIPSSPSLPSPMSDSAIVPFPRFMDVDLGPGCEHRHCWAHWHQHEHRHDDDDDDDDDVDKDGDEEKDGTGAGAWDGDGDCMNLSFSVSSDLARADHGAFRRSLGSAAAAAEEEEEEKEENKNPCSADSRGRDAELVARERQADRRQADLEERERRLEWEEAVMRARMREVERKEASLAGWVLSDKGLGAWQ